jgi:peptidoglycan/LPS O-acetylase OafA/YrhL
VVLLTGAILLIAAVSLGYKWWAFYVWDIPVAPLPKEGYSIYFGLLAKMDTFAIGMLLAVAVVAAKGRAYFGGVLAWLLRIAGGALLVWAFIMRAESPPVELYIHTLSGAGFVMILASTVLGTRGGTTWQRILTNPALQFLGLVSYSVYIWHEPLMLELRNHTSLIHDAPSAFPWNALVLVIGSIAVATLSYWLIEHPMTKLRYLFTKDGRLVRRYSK